VGDLLVNVPEFDMQVVENGHSTDLRAYVRKDREDLLASLRKGASDDSGYFIWLQRRGYITHVRNRFDR
jgi:hypothetical protein